MRWACHLHGLHLLPDLRAVSDVLQHHGAPAVVFDGFTSRALGTAELATHDVHAVWQMAWVCAVCACSRVSCDPNFGLDVCCDDFSYPPTTSVITWMDCVDSGVFPVIARDDCPAPCPPESRLGPARLDSGGCPR